MTYLVTIERTMDTAEGNIHWCDVERVEADNPWQAKGRVVVNELFDHLVSIRPEEAAQRI